MSAAVMGACIGSAAGGRFSDKIGRKRALLFGDALFAIGAVQMAAAGSASSLISGKVSSLPQQ